jgi:uncharacterized cupin superfamily protein
MPAQHISNHENYEYYKRRLMPYGSAEQCNVSVYEIPPGKSAYPYHYHLRNEEVFYIISGTGILKTPGEERVVSCGELIYFPANENGAHKLTNASETETLVYIDFDTRNEIDVCFYPDSEKIGIWGKGINKTFRNNQFVNYYDGE